MNLIMAIFMSTFMFMSLLLKSEGLMMVSALSLAAAPFMFNSMETQLFVGELIFLDGYSILLIMLTLIIFMFIWPTNLVLSFKNMSLKVKIISMLQMILVLIFTCSKTIFFYMLFELSLIPIFLIIMGWGYQIERLSAGAAMLMYTISASLPLLIAICLLWFNSNVISFPMSKLATLEASNMKMILVLMLMISFLVKFPIYLGHLWLPKAHVEAPASGSMILAAILLKLGGYGMIRFSSFFLVFDKYYLIMVITLLGGVWSGIVCVQNPDMKIVIAYSSIAHMAIVIAALLTLSDLGLSAAMILMIAHGFSSSGLFFCVGVFSNYSNSRSLLMNKSLLASSPLMAAIWFMVLMAGMGVPPTINFWGELMSMLAFCPDYILNTLPSSGMIFLAGAYSLVLYSVSSHYYFTPHSVKLPSFTPLEKTIGVFHMIWCILLVLIMFLFE